MPDEMRTRAELQRAHDLITGLVLGETGVMDLDDTTIMVYSTAATVLCWVLHHDHVTGFSDALRDIEAAAAARGFALVDGKECRVRSAPRCEGCGCEDQVGCPEGCAWDETFLAADRHVCSSCAPEIRAQKPPIVVVGG
jgi:hypothetical protein